MREQIINKLLSGRYGMLMMFGTTICMMAFTSLIGAMWVHDAAKLSLLTRILDTLIGFIAGAYTTMWNNYSHSENQKDLSKKEENQDTLKMEVTKNVDNRQNQGNV